MEKSLDNYESMPYRMYTDKSELDIALSPLKGLVEGIAIDGIVTQSEVEELIDWVDGHSRFEKRLSYTELLPGIREIVADGITDKEEINDFLWICRQVSIEGKYYDIVTLYKQELEGIFHGILSDNNLSDEEIINLRTWLENNLFLKGIYPV